MVESFPWPSHTFCGSLRVTLSRISKIIFRYKKDKDELQFPPDHFVVQGVRRHRSSALDPRCYRTCSGPLCGGLTRDG